MDNETNEPQDVETTEVEETEEIETPAPTDDINELKAQLKKYEERGITQRERTRALKAEIEKLKKAVQPVQAPSKTSDLDETQLDYLDLKGISEPEDIAIIQKYIQRTGETVRQALKDDYVQSKLTANSKEREVKAATPSSTRRSGNNEVNDVALAVSKFEQSGILPDDFTLRTQVVNYITERANPNKPRWH